MFWVAVLYSGSDQAIAHLIGRPSIRLTIDNRRSRRIYASVCTSREEAEGIDALCGEGR